MERGLRDEVNLGKSCRRRSVNEEAKEMLKRIGVRNSHNIVDRNDERRSSLVLVQFLNKGRNHHTHRCSRIDQKNHFSAKDLNRNVKDALRTTFYS